MSVVPAGLFADPHVGIPLPPPVLTQLLDDGSSLPPSALLLLLDGEPELSDRVLELATRPYYSGQQPPSQLPRLLDRLGGDACRALVLEAALEHAFYLHPPAGLEAAMAQLHRHAAASAYLVRVVARYAPIPVEAAFSLALLQHAGLAVGLSAAAQRAGAVDDALWGVLVAAHEPLARLVVQRWGFSPALQEAAGHHHSLRRAGLPAPLTCALAVAEDLAEELGYGLEIPAHPAFSGDQRAEARAALHLTDHEMRRLREDGARILELL